MSSNLSGDIQLNSITSSAPDHCHKVDVQGSIGFDGEWVLRKFFCDGTGDTINLERRLADVTEVKESVALEEVPATDDDDDDLPEYRYHAIVPTAKIPRTEEQRFEDAVKAGLVDQPRTLRNQSRQHSQGAAVGQVQATDSTVGNRKRTREPSIFAPKPELTESLDNIGEDEPDEDKPPPLKRSSNGRAMSRVKDVLAVDGANNDEQDGDVVENTKDQAPVKKARAKRAKLNTNKSPVAKSKKANKKNPGPGSTKTGRSLPKDPKQGEVDEDESQDEVDLKRGGEESGPQAASKKIKKVG